MANQQPAPLAEAIEVMGNAAKAFLDAPLAQLSAWADHATRPTYDANAAAADAALYSLHLARAYWGGCNAVLDATAVLAVSAGSGHRFVVTVPAVSVPSTVSIVQRTWTNFFVAEPEGVEIHVRPPVVLQPGTVSLELHATTPPIAEPMWEVVLGIAPLVGGTATQVTVRLDPTTEVSPPGP